MFSLKAASIIPCAFDQTDIHLLKPPSTITDAKIMSSSCTTTMQYGEGEKAVELDVMAQGASKDIKFARKDTTNQIKILKEKEDTSCNILIRSVVFEFMNKTLFLSSQEIKRAQQGCMKAKAIKVGNLSIKESRTNPDISRGLYCKAEYRAQARAIQNAKNKKAKMDILKRVEIAKEM